MSSNLIRRHIVFYGYVQGVGFRPFAAVTAERFGICGTVANKGSYVEIMKSLLARENPLYGRVDLAIDLKPMDYYESAMFYPSFSSEDKVRLYSVFGGIPYYNRLVDPALSVRENIQELISAPGARLENEVSMYLKSEISKIANANEVFEALSKGFSKYSDLLSQSHVSSGPTLVDVLEKLIRMEVVEKQAPINDADNRRKSGYFIVDNLSLFYYRYIFRFLSQRNVLDEDVFYDRYIREDFSMRMNGNIIHSVNELKRNFVIDELIDSYYSGELEFFLRSIGDAGRLKKLRSSVRQNAYMLVDLYDVFDISPEMTEEEVRISLQ